MTNQIFTLLYHYTELKYRIIYFLLSILLTFICVFYYSEEFFYFFATPLISISLKNIKFISTDLAEIFIVFFKSSIYLSLLFSFPVLIVQIVLFIIPGLYQYEKKTLLGYLFIFFFIFILGFLSSIYFFIPLMWNFFFNFEINTSLVKLILEAKISQYYTLTLQTIFLFTLSFEIPFIFFLLINFNIIAFENIINKRQYFLLLTLIISALITPPEVLSQILVSIPLILSYEMIIIIILWKKKKEQKAKNKKNNISFSSM